MNARRLRNPLLARSLLTLLTDAYLRSLEKFKQHVSRVSMAERNMQAKFEGCGGGHGDLT